ncbi:MAG: glyoxalase [Eubacterium sp.]|nr:glyoxalase [Eubacterium sp.]
MELSDLSVKYFLEHQDQLFDEEVAYDEESAREFLEDNFAVLCESLDEVRNYLDEEGMDVTGMTDDELLEQAEVFDIGDGTYLVVEG